MTNELTFWPATISGKNWYDLPGSITKFDELAPEARAEIENAGYETGEKPDGSILIGVPANHDSVFTVGPYTVTLDR